MGHFLVIALIAALAPAAGGCRGDESHGVVDVKQGMTKQHVRALAGEPDRAGPRCWIYRPSSLDAGDGRRLCFDHRRVSLVQFIRHGAGLREAIAGDGWRSVLDDYGANRRFDHVHSCQALRAALARVPATSLFFSTAVAGLRGAETRACHS